MMKVFCTGLTGFIGSYLAKSLINHGIQIMSLKRETSDLSRLEDVYDKIKWIKTSEDWGESVIEFAPNAIFNIAWNGVSSTERILWDSQISNIGLQQKLLNIALKCGTRKFIGIGSQSEYGDFENIIDEEYSINPKTAYAASKAASLILLKTFCEINKIEWYWFRVFPVFGPYESSNWLIPSLIKNICTSDHMDLTPGEQKLAYLYVGECANAIASALNVSGKSGIYNICSNKPIPLKELVSKIRDKINPHFKLNFGAQQYRYGQCMYMEGDTKKLRDNLYILNTNDFEKRLNETINYYLNKYEYNK